MVSYNSPGLIDSVKDGVSGIILETNSPQEMANMIKEVLKEPSRYNKLQEGSISWSKNFSWEKSRRMSLKLIESI